MKVFVNYIIFLLLSIYAHGQYLIIGTYTSESTSKGIYVYDFDNKTGKAKAVSYAEAGNPSYLAISKNGKYVYSVNENDKGKISSFSFNKKTGQLSWLNSQDNKGSAPCYVELDKTGKWLFSGNYSSGDLTLHPVNTDGTIGTLQQWIRHSGSGPDKERQQTPHVHCTYISADNHFLYVPDLGIDKVMIYPFNAAKGILNENKSFYAAVEPRGGPRHITFSPDNKYAYVIEELSGSISAFKNKNGTLVFIQRINKLPEGDKGAGADIHVSPDGKFLYASQRSNNTIQIFKINSSTGKLMYVNAQSTMGKTPRNFTIYPSGDYLLAANQNSDDVVIFKRNKQTGLLFDTEQRIQVGKPVCLKWINH